MENTQVEQQSWGADTDISLHVTTIEDMVMIDIQIVGEDFGLFPLIINPTGRICLIPEAGFGRGVSMKTHTGWFF